MCFCSKLYRYIWARLRTFTFVVLLVILLFPAGAVSSVLAPDEILIVSSSSSGPEGTRIANEYCAKRRVPESQIAAFPMPGSETISRNAYDSYIADPLRKFLENTPGLKRRIRCLLTVYGVPLRIGRYTPTSEEKRIVVSLTDRLEKKHQALREQMRVLRRVAQRNERSAIVSQDCV